MFKIGDRVECVNDGACYDNYDEWVKSCAPDYYRDYRKSIYHRTNTKDSSNALGIAGTVVAVADHSQCCDIEVVLVVPPSGDVFLIEERGLKYVKDDESSIWW